MEKVGKNKVLIGLFILCLMIIFILAFFNNSNLAKDQSLDYEINKEYAQSIRGKKVVWFGDYLIEGSGNNNKSWNYYMDKYYGTISDNYAVGSATVLKTNNNYNIQDQILENTSSIKEADYIFINGGVNDCWGYQQDELSFDQIFVKIEDNIKKLLEIIGEKNNQKIIYIIPHKFVSNNYMNYVEKTIDICEKYEINCVELGSIISDLDTVDGIYYNEEGYKKSLDYLVQCMVTNNPQIIANVGQEIEYKQSSKYNSYFKNKTIVCIGDSIIQGAANYERSWDYYINKYYGSTSENYGVGGSTVTPKDGKGYIKDQIIGNNQSISKADYVLMDGGINDCWILDEENQINKIISSIKDNIQQVINLVGQENKNNIVYIIPHKFSSVLYVDYLKQVKSTCDEMGIKYVNLDEVLTDFDTTDSVHYTENGYLKSLDVIIDTLIK